MSKILCETGERSASEAPEGITLLALIPVLPIGWQMSARWHAKLTLNTGRVHLALHMSIAAQLFASACGSRRCGRLFARPPTEVARVEGGSIDVAERAARSTKERHA